VDYPLLNLLFGLALVLANTVSTSLAVLLTKARLPIWLARASWVALVLGLLPAVYALYLLLQQSLPAMDRQFWVGGVVMVGLGTLATARLYRAAISPGTARVMLGLQLLSSLLSVIIAFGLYRSLVPVVAVLSR
jgi:hypothetical protein